MQLFSTSRKNEAAQFVKNQNCSSILSEFTTGKKGKAVPLQAWTGPEGSTFHDNARG